MPNYEYECPICNNSEGTALKFEVSQGYSDKVMVRCPKCKSTCRRLISIGRMEYLIKE